MSIINLLPIIVTLGGTFLLFKLRFFFIAHPVRTGKKLREALCAPGAKASLSLALAGTLGVGNIVGVAVGISVGGAGSVLWLLFSCVFASVLKYCESALAADGGGGFFGMIGAVGRAFGKNGKIFAHIYAFLCLVLSLLMGAALQASSVAASVAPFFDISAVSVAVVLAIAVLAVILRGACRIDKLTSIIIPITTLLYVFLSVCTIACRISVVPQVALRIVSEAFTFDGAFGGTLGFMSSLAVREGFCRGLLSNEAGAGTSAFANARGEGGAGAGLLGMCEVFFDTVLLCMLTAFSILVCIPDVSAYSSGMALVLDSIGAVFGAKSHFLLMLCIISFAFSTIVCWYYYGTRCMEYLFGGGKTIYSLCFLSFIVIGCLCSEGAAVFATDYILFGLTFITVMTLIKSSDRIRALSERGGLIIPRI